MLPGESYPGRFMIAAENQKELTNRAGLRARSAVGVQHERTGRILARGFPKQKKRGGWAQGGGRMKGTNDVALLGTIGHPLRRTIHAEWEG